MPRNWKIVEHSAASRWAVKYASINPNGEIQLSRVTIESMGNPKSVVLMYEAETETIGLKPARNGEQHAFPLRKRGSRGGHLLRGYILMKDHHLKLTQTLKFPDIQTELGVLLLDLRTAEPVRRA
ncbi:MAG: hypothetical protein KA956_07445 [Pyrinomonadaceae bacterium]|nr:hypothetical protein [Pyrinomonadaceae bacterium]